MRPPTTWGFIHNMKLTVLGKYGPYGKAGTGAASSYLVENGKDCLVLDMGAGTLSRLIQAVDIRKVKYFYISHLHYDHTSDFLVLRYLLEEIGHKIVLFIEYEDSPWYKILTEHRNITVINVCEGREFTAGSFTLTFFRMKHTVPCLGVRIKGEKTLAYTGDTLYNDNIPALIDGADCVLADCSKPAGFKGPHMTVENAKKISREYGVRIIATHLSPGYSPEKEFSGEDKIETAQELKVYEL